MQKTTVTLKILNTYDHDVCLKAMRDLLAPLGGMQAFVKPGQTVLLKPNILGGFAPEKAVTTHPSIVRAVSLLVQEAGGKVLIGDSPGTGGFKGSAKASGIWDIIEATGSAPADFEESAVYELEDNRLARRISLAKALQDADVFITLPKLKTHVQMGFTGAIKNQFGLVVGMEKAKYHYRLKTREMLADLMIEINRIARPALAIMDGVIAMEGHGPSGGEPREVGALIAGTDPAAVDTVACSLIGLDSNKLPLMQAADRYDFGITKLDAIDIIGEDLAELAVSDFKTVDKHGDILRIIPVPRMCYDWIRRILTPRPDIIRETCIKCGACSGGCPVEPAAIDPNREPGKEVDDRRCIRCYCCHEFCPVKAIALKRSWPDRIFHLNGILSRIGRLIDRLQG